jgi:protein-disulfide isomerase
VNAFVGYAEDLELDADALRTCIDDRGTIDRVNEDIREAAQENINSTPTFFVNETRIVGGDEQGLRDAIDDALGR